MRRTTALAVALVLGAACGGSGSNLSRVESTEQVRALVDATAEAVADGLTVTPQPDSSLLPMGCTNNAGKVLDTIEVPYEVVLTLKPATDIPALLEQTHAHWEADGYDVGEIEVPNSSRPTIHANRDGYRFSVEVQKDLGRALLGGTTPCVKTAG